jgi:type I restriction enzyme S subunit
MCFGDLVQNVTKAEISPAAAGIERFIGLEHLEPGSLHVREWGNVADGTTFTRVCRPGQVLFGKRRAYQRKVAVAEFDAVVSGDIYVLAPKNDRLLPNCYLYLPVGAFLPARGGDIGWQVKLTHPPRTHNTATTQRTFHQPPNPSEVGLRQN